MKMPQTKDRKHSGARALCIMIGSCLLLSTGFGGSTGALMDLQQRRDDGREIFLKSCAACHGQDARGLPGLGKDLVASTFVRQLSDEELVDFIERGRPSDDALNTTGVPMPSRGGNASLTRDDLKAVVAYLRSLQEE